MIEAKKEDHFLNFRVSLPGIENIFLNISATNENILGSSYYRLMKKPEFENKFTVKKLNWLYRN